MWKDQFQQAEEKMMGFSWLLFLANKFNKEGLKSQIWEITDITVVL